MQDHEGGGTTAESSLEARARLGKPAKKSRLIVTISIACFIAVIAVGAAIYKIRQPSSILPASTSSQIQGFVPYFYQGQIPAEYTVDTAKISTENNILLIPLSHPDGARIVLTEQAMPAKLTEKDVLQFGKEVEGSKGQAVMQNVEGRLVGTMVTTDKTLILLNTTGSTSKNDMTLLLQNLRPIR